MEYWGDLIFENVINLYQGMMFITFALRFFGNKYGKGRTIAAWTGGVIVWTSTIIILNHITIFEGLLGLMVFMLEFYIFSGFFLKGKSIAKLLVSIYSISLLSVTSGFVMGIVAQIGNCSLVEIYSEGSPSRYLGVILVQIFMTYLLEMSIRLAGKNAMKLQKTEWGLILSVLFLSIAAIMIINQIQLNNAFAKQSGILFLVLILGIGGINLVVYYLILKMSKANQNMLENELIQQQYESFTKGLEETSIQYHEMQQIRHDMKNVYLTIYQLLETENYTEAKQYVDENIQDVKRTNMILVNTHDVLLDALLNAKFSYAREKQIETKIQIVSDFSGVDKKDLCSLLGNLLDNAIEAAGQCMGSCTMELMIKGDEDKLMIWVSNTIEEAVLERNHHLETTKPEKQSHGYGIQSVRRIAAHYNGSVDFSEQEHMFTAFTILFRRRDI